MMWRQGCGVKSGDKGMRVEDGGGLKRETMTMEVENWKGGQRLWSMSQFT